MALSVDSRCASWSGCAPKPPGVLTLSEHIVTRTPITKPNLLPRPSSSSRNRSFLPCSRHLCASSRRAPSIPNTLRSCAGGQLDGRRGRLYSAIFQKPGMTGNGVE